MIKPPERVEIPEDEAPRERFARFLAVAIVVSTLLLALVEFAHGYDSQREDSAAVDAQRYGAQRLGAATRADDLARTDLQIFGIAEDERTRAGNQAQIGLNRIVVDALANTDASNDPQFTNVLATDKRYNALAALTEKLTTIDEGSTYGPDHDPGFPGRDLSQATMESEKLFAQQDAANEEREAWEGRLSQYAVLLTLLAVAVYLFGLSLTLQAGVRRIITGLAVALVLVSAGWGGGLQLVRPSRAPDAAADAYAHGRVDALTALTVADLKKAEAELSQAISLRPTFAEAYVERAGIRFIEGSPEFGQNGIISITSSDALHESTADLQKAYDLGLRTFELLNNLADGDILVGLYDNDASYYQKAIDLTNQGLAVDDSNPLLYGNLGQAKLLIGDQAGAGSAFDQMVDRTLYIGEKHTPRDDSFFEQEELSGMLTALQLDADHRPDLAGQVKTLKEHLVAAIHPPKKTTPVAIQDAQAQVFPSTLQWTGTIPSLTADDTVSVQWYHQDPQKLGWGAIGGTSGVYTPQPNGPPGEYYDLHRFVLDTGGCTIPGRYRVEVYVNGHLSATAEADADSSVLQPALSRSMGVALCIPKGWVHDDSDFIRGLGDAWTSPDKSHGAAMLRFEKPDPSIGSDDTSRAIAYRDELIPSYFDHVMPQGLKPTTSITPQTQYFLGLNSQTVVYETDGNGNEALVGCGVNTDGSIIVGVIYGPTDDFGSSQIGQHVFDGLLLES